MQFNFEYIDIILLAMIVGFIALRLRGILGRKTGHQGKVADRFNNVTSIDKNQVFEVKQEKNNQLDDEIKKNFLGGAKIAYETIVTSFAKGDKKSLKTLLSDKVFKNFSDVIDERKKNNLTVETTFIGIKSAQINSFQKNDNIYNITVNFVSELITSVKNKEDKVIEGNPDTIITVKDSWKFSKNMWSTNPTWYLTETFDSV